MDIKVHRYELKSKTRKRVGALLKIDFETHWGVGDLCPIEEWGDASLEEELLTLKMGELSSLSQRSIYYAEIDAKARGLKKALLTKAPPSNLLLQTFDPVPAEFSHIKIKLGADLPKEIEWLLHLKTTAKLRLDFNEKLTEGSFRAFLNEVEPIWPKIDYIEDPFAYDDRAWNRVQEDYPISLACDRSMPEAVGQSPHVLIWKPMRNKMPLTKQRVVATSSLDHPIGQLVAAFSGMILDEVGGYLSHRWYDPTPFSKLIESKGSRLAIPPGFGFGFDELLEKIEWKKI
jgi:hypothetical protein